MKKQKNTGWRKMPRMPKGQNLGTKIHKDRRKEAKEETGVMRCFWCAEITEPATLAPSLYFGTSTVLCMKCWVKLCEQEGLLK